MNGYDESKGFGMEWPIKVFWTSYSASLILAWKSQC